MGRWSAWVQFFFGKISRLLVSIWIIEPAGTTGLSVRSSLPMMPFKYDRGDSPFDGRSVVSLGGGSGKSKVHARKLLES